MASDEHRHDFRPADLRHTDGTPIPGGCRCACGFEAVGDGPFRVNASLVRAGRDVQLAMGKTLAAVGRAMTEGSKR